MAEISFIDEVFIKVKSGDGGNGISSFHREKYIDKGGPDGGNGGKGGSIYFKSSNNLNTLLNFRRRRIFKAENGQSGGRNNRTGKSGNDLIIEVPVGTEIIIDDKKVSDLFFQDQMYLLDEGGKGGRGNSVFKSSKNNAPRLYENGEKKEFIELKLNLKVLADVGLLGYPNVGKSTFLSIISNAKPKIANYPFTTLIPNLGMVNYNEYNYVVTDLPGLIEGASENKGMGREFLKHLSRTKLILHILDSSFEDIEKKYTSLREELEKYSADLYKKEEVILINKIDLIDETKKNMIEKIFENKKLFFMSALEKKGINELLIFLGKEITEIRKIEEEELIKMLNESDYELIKLRDEENLNDENFEIIKNDNTFEISGKFPEYWAQRIPVDNHENFLRIWIKFKNKGIIRKLQNMGIKENDIVIVKNTKLVFEFKKNML